MVKFVNNHFQLQVKTYNQSGFIICHYKNGVKVIRKGSWLAIWSARSIYWDVILGWCLHGQYPTNTKHLYNICTMLDQRQRRWADVVQMLYKCFVIAGLRVILVGGNDTLSLLLLVFAFELQRLDNLSLNYVRSSRQHTKCGLRDNHHVPSYRVWRARCRGS